MDTTHNKLWNMSFVFLSLTALSILGVGLSSVSYINIKTLNSFANEFVTDANNTNKTILNNDCGITIVTNQDEIKSDINITGTTTSYQKGCGVETVLPFYYSIINTDATDLKFLENTTNLSVDSIREYIVSDLQRFFNNQSEWEIVMGALNKYPVCVEFDYSGNQNYKFVQDFNQIVDSYNHTNITTFTPEFNYQDSYKIKMNEGFYPTETPLIVMLVFMCLFIIGFIVCMILSKIKK